MKSVKLKKGRSSSIQRLHPWVFSGGIATTDAGIEQGDIVKILDAEGKVQGVGHYEGGSLAVKVLSFNDVPIDQAWIEGKLKAALNFRNIIGFPSDHTNAYRLVHGEGDEMPGLIVDVYDHTAVVQPHSIGMERMLKPITEALVGCGFTNVVHKPTGRGKTAALAGEVSGMVRILENGMHINVDIINGQKTGFFLDQRNNRNLLRSLSKDKSVLNAFSYTGGFSVAAGLGGAKSMVSLDGSALALEIASENAKLNGLADKHSCVKADAIKYLEGSDEKFDIIILDPPAFAKHKSARHNAIQAYRRINQAALSKLEKGGIMMTFSCSQVIDRQLFNDTVVSAGINLQMPMQILQHLRQPEDHPVLLTHPEGEYLKGLTIRKL